MRGCVVVMAKASVMGRVKTRLARDIGPVAALRFYRGSLDALLRGVKRAANMQVMLALSPDRLAVRPPRWTRSVGCLPQGRGDLGRRMVALLRKPHPGPVLLVGADIPDLAPSHIRAALQAIRRPGVVFGPARDGGFWCIGRGPGTVLPPRWLRGVAWSRPDTLAASLAATPGRKAVLPITLADIDTGADLRRWKTGKGRR